MKIFISAFWFLLLTNNIGAQTFQLKDTLFYVGDQLTHSGLYNPDCQIDMRSVPFLDSLSNFLMKNKQITIEIGLHSDIRGSSESSKRVTEVCGQKRLTSFFESKNPDLIKRITFKCFGESKPIFTQKEIDKIPNREEKQRANFANNRTVIKIIKINSQD